MTDLHEAADRIAAKAREHGLRIDQVDPVLAECGSMIVFYAYSTAGDCLFATADLPMRLTTESALLIDEWRDAFMRLLPSEVLAAEKIT